VVEVLKPLEVRDGDTTTVHEKIRAADDAAGGEDLLSSESSGAVGTLNDSLALEVGGVALVNGLLSCSGDEEIALLLHERKRVLELNFLGAWVSSEGSLLCEPFLGIIRVDTSGVVDGRVVLNNGSNLATIAVEEPASPEADITETLKIEGAVLETLGETQLLVEGFVMVHQLTEGVVDTETSGFGSASDTTLRDVFTSAATLSINVLLSSHLLICILDPGHNLFIGSHVGAKAIDGGSNEALLDELHGVTTSDSLELSLAQAAGVNLDTTLGTTEGDIGDSELEGHKRSESFSFL